jgi:hypothetical protein
LITAWSYKYKEYEPFLLTTIKIIMTQTLSIILLVPSILTLLSDKNIQFDVASILILCVIAGAILQYKFIMFIKPIDIRLKYPFEFKFYSNIYYYFTEIVPKFAGPPGTLGGAATLPTAYLVVLMISVFYSMITSIITITRLLLFAFFMILWLIIFSPAKMLNFVAKHTGADSYIKVGKYFVLLIITVFYKIFCK